MAKLNLSGTLAFLNSGQYTRDSCSPLHILHFITLGSLDLLTLNGLSSHLSPVSAVATLIEVLGVVAAAASRCLFFCLLVGLIMVVAESELSGLALSTLPESLPWTTPVICTPLLLGPPDGVTTALVSFLSSPRRLLIIACESPNWFVIR